ncbi:MAG: hypothetical protein LBK99_07710 [Opitutaceae bacterium]|jgi:hypothetical protein|nr:hypothetical protein [Opitutaceae bacterium]
MKTNKTPLIPGIRLRIATLSLIAVLVSAFTPSLLTAVVLDPLVATQDTFVYAYEATSVKGAGIDLQVAARSPGYGRKIYLGFDLSGVEASTTVFDSSSALSLTLKGLIGTYSGSGSSATVTVNVYGITDSTALFSQNTLNWSNSGPYKNTTTSTTGISSEGTALLGSFAIDTLTSAGTSVTMTGSGLADYLNWAIGNSGDHYGTGATRATDKKVTLILAIAYNQSNEGGYTNVYPGFTFHSIEASVDSSLKPHLLLSTSTVPEPATVATLAGLAVLGAAFLHRRHKAGK